MSVLNPEIHKSIDGWVAKFPAEHKRSALLMALRVTQDALGYLSDEAINAVADYLELPRIWAYEVVSFYSLYHRQAVGRYVIRLCGSIACHLRGAHSLMHHLEKTLGIQAGQTTSDGLFTLLETECLAACTAAPALTINDKTYRENLTLASVDALIETLRQEAQDAR